MHEKKLILLNLCQLYRAKHLEIHRLHLFQFDQHVLFE